MLQKYFPQFEDLYVEVDDATIHTVVGGQGSEAILFLHGHPENYLIWRFIAPTLAKKYKVVLTDLRGYGDSSKPKGLSDHSNYSKRVMAKDQVQVMEKLGINKFHLVGHDRGARVAHRLILDYPEKIASCTFMDILPTDDMYDDTNKEFATKYWHWFFYIQDNGFPETLLGSNPEFFIRFNLQKKVCQAAAHRFPEEIIKEYIKYYGDPATVHGISEDYRASATIDRIHNDVDRDTIIDLPVLAMWGKNGVVGNIWDVPAGWKKTCSNLSTFGVPDCGHFVPEEQPEIVLEQLTTFIEKNTYTEV